jgi:hypothetical protein
MIVLIDDNNPQEVTYIYICMCIPSVLLQSVLSFPPGQTCLATSSENLYCPMISLQGTEFLQIPSLVLQHASIVLER